MERIEFFNPLIMRLILSFATRASLRYHSYE